jgi:3-phenylpropionate/trans-cinnamate dioxygenase ferredoxin reductase subunit
VADLRDGQPTIGRFRDQSVILVRTGEQVRAIAAACSHYSGPLEDGVVVGDTVRCPWHHACFSLDSGEVLAAPALNALDSYAIVREGDRVRITDKRSMHVPGRKVSSPSSVVIVGAGAAGAAAAEMLRREEYDGPVTLVGADASVPYDRPNLSKDYLAGNAPEEWIPLRPREFYAEQRIDLRTGVEVTDLDARNRTVTLTGGETLPFGALLLATGARPRRLSIPGADLPFVQTLRTLADSRALIERAKTARRAVLIGGGFIGLEVAAALRARGLEVALVTADAQPLARVVGVELGAMVRAIHEEHGLVFQLGQSPAAISPDGVVLANGTTLPADLVVLGVGVEPDVVLAQKAGLALDRGVKVDAHLETSVPGIFAAGDIARWPDPHTGQSIRVEHWVVAQRQGQTAARNMLGEKQRFRAVPFFWSAHYDVTIAYVGHAESWDRVAIDGDPTKRDCRVGFYQGERRLAVATVGRDRDSLQAEAEMQAAVGEAY